MQIKNYYSLQEIAKLLGISRISVYKKVKKGEIAAERIGRSYAVPKKEISYITGEKLRKEDMKQIDNAVKKTIDNYAEVLIKLGKE